MCKNLPTRLALAAGLAVASFSPAFAGKTASPAAAEYADFKLGMSVMSAEIGKDATVLYAAGAVAARYIADFKTYMVTFNRPVTGCASMVTPLYEHATATSHTHGSLKDSLTVTFFDPLARPNMPRNSQVLVFCPR